MHDLQGILPEATGSPLYLLFGEEMKGTPFPVPTAAHMNVAIGLGILFVILLLLGLTGGAKHFRAWILAMAADLAAAAYFINRYLAIAVVVIGLLLSFRSRP